MPERNASLTIPAQVAVKSMPALLLVELIDLQKLHNYKISKGLLMLTKDCDSISYLSKKTLKAQKSTNQ